MTDTSIEWTQKTWNPIRGCTRVSSGCKNCYAERVAHRFGGPGQPYEGLTVLSGGSPRWAGKARFVPEMLSAPLKWRKPQRVFVNSMSDLFHEDIGFDQIAAIFGVMAACPQHVFQVLTKRPERMREWFQWVDQHGNTEEIVACKAAQILYPDKPGAHFAFEHHCEDTWPLLNVWIGVSTEDQDTANERVPLLLKTPAAVRFVSAEPLLGPIDFDPIGNAMFDREAAIRHAINGPAAYNREQADDIVAEPELDWVIVGGESGPGARQCNVDWVRSIVHQSKRAGVACFVKQLGSCYVDAENAVGGYQAKPPPEYGKLSRRLVDRKGGDMTEWPEDLCVREFPKA